MVGNYVSLSHSRFCHSINGSFQNSRKMWFCFNVMIFFIGCPRRDIIIVSSHMVSDSSITLLISVVIPDDFDSNATKDDDSHKLVSILFLKLC